MTGWPSVPPGLSLSPSQQGLGLLSGGDVVGGVSVGVLESGDKTVGGWLRALGLPQYEDVFVAQGYDDTDFMVSVNLCMMHPTLLYRHLSTPLFCPPFPPTSALLSIPFCSFCVIISLSFFSLLLFPRLHSFHPRLFIPLLGCDTDGQLQFYTKE